MIDGIHHIHVETHNWGKSVAFWQALGYELAEDFGGSGILRATAPGQPYLYLEEVSPDATPAMQFFLNASEEFAPAKPVVCDGGWHDSHWDTRLLEVTDPDGRTFIAQVAGSQ